MKTYSLRIPAAWCGRITSPEAAAWLYAYLRRPAELPADPGPGDARISVTLPHRAVAILAAVADRPASSALRALFAGHLGPVARPAPAAVILAPPRPVQRLSAAQIGRIRYPVPRRGLFFAPRPDVKGLVKLHHVCFALLIAGGVLWGMLRRPAAASSGAAIAAPALEAFNSWKPA